MIKAIIFDFFGVISTRGLDRFADDYLWDAQKMQQAHELREMGDRGVITLDELMNGLCELAGVSKEVIYSYHDKAQLNQPLIDYIRNDLKPYYKISILSNAAGDYTEEIMGKTNLALFDDMVLSYRVNMVKPQPEIYKLAASNLGAQPAECVFIDDSPSSYDGAVAAGMKAVWYQDFHQMKQQLQSILAHDTAANN